MTQSQLLETSVHDDTATTELLMQLFFSDRTHTPEDQLNKLGGVASQTTTTTTPPTMLDISREPSVTSTASSPTSLLATVPQLPSPNPLTELVANSEATSPCPLSPTTHAQSQRNSTMCNDVVTVLLSSASPLECTDSDGLNDPLDNPFLTESTDLSVFLQDPSISTMLSSTVNTALHSTTVCTNDSNTTPFPVSLMSESCPSVVSTNVHMNLGIHTHNDDINLFDFSQDALLLPPSFDIAELEALDIDFSVLSANSLDFVPTGIPIVDSDAMSDQVSVVVSQAQQTTSTSSSTDIDPPSISNSVNSDDVFVDPTPSPCVSDQTELSVTTSKVTKSRKRQRSDFESDNGESAPEAKKTKSSRREKNNVASQVSRAKRRAKNTAMFDRVGELESENATLRIKEKELTDEIEKLKKLLVLRLSQ